MSLSLLLMLEALVLMSLWAVDTSDCKVLMSLALDAIFAEFVEMFDELVEIFPEFVLILEAFVEMSPCAVDKSLCNELMSLAFVEMLEVLLVISD